MSAPYTYRLSTDEGKVLHEIGCEVDFTVVGGRLEVDHIKLDGVDLLMCEERLLHDLGIYILGAIDLDDGWKARHVEIRQEAA